MKNKSVMSVETLKTKFGNARLNPGGYYQITSRKEGNNKKSLHRLIWGDHHGKSVPDGYDIHHINGDKLDNRIQNLQCVERTIHHLFHHTGENHPFLGRKHSIGSREKMRKAHIGFKYSEETKAKWSLQRKLGKNPNYRHDLKNEEISKLKKEKGYTYTQIAEILNCGRSTVYRRFKHMESQGGP